MTKKRFIQYLYVTLGVFLIAAPYYFLFLPLNIVTGGVTGLSVILNDLIPQLSPSVFIYIANGILLIIGLIFLGKDFFFKTVYGSLLLPTITFILEKCKVPTDFLFTIDSNYFNLAAMSDLSKLAIAVVIGAIMMGAGLGICFRNNASTGGMDVIQKLLAKYVHFPYSKTVYVTDGLIVLGSFFVFGFERTIYALITIFLEGYVCDYFSMGGKTQRTAFIISTKDAEIKEYIHNVLERGSTIVPSNGGYSGANFNMIVCTLSKEESYLLRDKIAEIDPGAFTFYVYAKEVYGNGFVE